MSNNKKNKLAIAVTYLVPSEYEFVFDMHLKLISEFTSEVDFTIYASVNLLDEKYKKRLEKEPFVKICSIKDTDQTISIQHSYYLDHLVRAAIDDGADYICTFDVDSFPIAPNWFETIRATMEREGTPLCGVFREENGDTVLPHPSCTVFTRAFYEAHQPSFFPDEATLNRSDYLSFFEETKQRLDTGIGYSFVLHKNSIPWTKLSRSNKIDEHIIMAGIYGDLIFHLGALARRKLFYIETVKYFEKYGFPLSEDLDTPERLALIAENTVIFDRICACMVQDMPGYIRYLKGEAPCPSIATTPQLQMAGAWQ